MKKKTTQIEIKFLSWICKASLHYKVETMRKAVEKAVADGANLYGANLSYANLYGAKYNAKKLWTSRPILTIGPCGSVGRTTSIFFFGDGSNPLIRCGCFSGNIDEFERKIHETHSGTFHEREYMAMARHIRDIIKLQKEWRKDKK